MKTIKYLAAIILFLAVNRSYASPADVNTAVNNVLKSYLGIKNALATDNSKIANDEAKKFTTALKEVPVSQMDAKQKLPGQSMPKSCVLTANTLANQLR